MFNLITFKNFCNDGVKYNNDLDRMKTYFFKNLLLYIKSNFSYDKVSDLRINGGHFIKINDTIFELKMVEENKKKVIIITIVRTKSPVCTNLMTTRFKLENEYSCENCDDDDIIKEHLRALANIERYMNFVL